MPNANDNINGVFGNSAGMPLVKDGYVTQQFHNTLKGRDEENSHPANAIDWSLYNINANTVASVVKDAPNVYSTKVDKVSGKGLSTNDFTNIYKSKIDNLGAVYNKGNILGTVSQSGGVPTGAIIESGSNVNGSYVKYADGTMICYRRLKLIYESVDVVQEDWSFPSTFASNPMINHTHEQGFSTDATPPTLKRGPSFHATTSTTKVTLKLGCITGAYQAGDFVYTNAEAIGKWY